MRRTTIDVLQRLTIRSDIQRRVVLTTDLPAASAVAVDTDAPARVSGQLYLLETLAIWTLAISSRLLVRPSTGRTMPLHPPTSRPPTVLRTFPLLDIHITRRRPKKTSRQLTLVHRRRWDDARLAPVPLPGSRNDRRIKARTVWLCEGFCRDRDLSNVAVGTWSSGSCLS